jgi:hypothetical protein
LRAALILTLALLLCAATPAGAGAVVGNGAAAGPEALAGTKALAGTEAEAQQTPTVTLKAEFSPEHLGAGTTVHLGFQITEPSGAIPPPLTELGVLYPAELGIATSDLGLEECSLARLEEDGLAGCPANSLMGHGSAQVDVPFLLGPVLEPVSITLLSGPVQEGHLGLLFFANGASPVLAALIFAGAVLPAQGPFGGILDTRLPLVASVPEGPDASLVRMETTIGPSHLTYYRRVRNRMVGFRPRGILLPSSCPHGGFLFTAHLTFQNGAHAETSTAVPCPRR